MAREVDPSQWKTLETAMMQQFVNALEDDYTKLKGSQYLLKYQTLMRGPWEGEACQPASPPTRDPSTPTRGERRQKSP